MSAIRSNNSRREAILLDTLAQNRTTSNSDFERPPLVIYGEGSDLRNVEALVGRAKRKTITQVMVLSLIDVATKKKKGDRVKAYWNTYHCQNRIVTHDGKLHTTYCKNRFCTVCLSIRKATIMNNYLPYLQTWEDPYFLTLTVKAIPAYKLPRYVNGMLGLFGKIIDKYRKKAKRRKGFALEGIRSLECNFNPVKRTYNPHFHILVRNKEMGEILLAEWLTRFPKRHANRLAQKLVKVDDRERALIEIVKYGSKIFTEPDLKKATRKTSRYIYVSALDNIFSAMQGRRIFDRFGFNLPEQRASEPKQNFRILIDYENWLYTPKLFDWVNIDSGETLSGYQLTNELKDILSNRIDCHLQ